MTIRPEPTNVTILQMTTRIKGIAPVLSLCIFLGACGPAKETDAATGTTAAATANEIIFSAGQVEHGGVRWESVASTSMTSRAEIPGHLVADEDRTARLGAPAQGRLVAVHVQFGDRVTRGQPLVTLLSPQAGTARADYAKAVAALRSSRAAATYASTAAERAERLLVAKAMSRQDVERARADNELAQSTLSQAQAEVARARAEMSQLGVNASGTMVLRSPLSGIVLSRDAVPGAVVDAGAPLVTVSDPSTLWLDISAPERVASSFRQGAEVHFTVPALIGTTFEARVQSVAGALDPATRALPVRAVVQNAERRLRPEMFATVWVDNGPAQAGIALPNDAIQLLDQKPVAFVARPDGKGGARFEKRDIELGAQIDGRTQVVRGVNPGELVVIAGAFAVKAEFARSKMSGG